RHPRPECIGAAQVARRDPGRDRAASEWSRRRRYGRRAAPHRRGARVAVGGICAPSLTPALPRGTVGTPSFHQGSFLERTIRSVLCQDYPDLEYIVVDGASTDGTAEVLRRYDAFIDQLVVEPDRGQGDAIAKGFRRASGDILAWLNSDDCYADNRV